MKKKGWKQLRGQKLECLQVLVGLKWTGIRPLGMMEAVRVKNGKNMLFPGAVIQSSGRHFRPNTNTSRQPLLAVSFILEEIDSDSPTIIGPLSEI